MVRITDPYRQTIVNVEGGKSNIFGRASLALNKIKQRERKVYEKRDERESLLKLKQDIKQIPRSLPKERIEQISENLKRKEAIRKDEKQLSELKKEASKIRREAVQKKAEKLMDFGQKTISQKILSKPSVKVQKYNAQRLVSQMAREQGALVQRRLEVPNRLPVASRSNLFDNEAQSEVKSTMKWFMED